MNDHITSNKQHPTQNFHKNLKNIQKPQKFQSKPKNLGLMREMHEEWRIRSSYHKIEAWLGQNLEGKVDLSERRVFGGREKENLSREKWKSEIRFRTRGI